MSLDSNIRHAIAHGKALIGTPYGKWTGGSFSPIEPMWVENKPPPNIVRNVSCVGLVNLMLRSINIPLPHSSKGGTGGTMAYSDYYHSVSEKFDRKMKYPEGTLIGRRYRYHDDQGHVAVVLSNGYVLQSIPKFGVNTYYTVEESHDNDYAVLPQNWLLGGPLISKL
jgi:cell wall-associated NlpC family hydrolase